MQVNTAVHESVRSDVLPGIPVLVRIDARPGCTFKGSLKHVEVMPDQGGWMGSDTKYYNAVVTIDEEVERLRPGMTAVVEIMVGRRSRVLCVPVQAVVQVDGNHWCYVQSQSGVERRLVTLGSTNEELVEVTEGLSEGERVVVNPSALTANDRDSERPNSP
jgi:HlyD family secretion protein